MQYILGTNLIHPTSYNTNIMELNICASPLLKRNNNQTELIEINLQSSMPPMDILPNHNLLLRPNSSKKKGFRFIQIKIKETQHFS